ncbi:MAG: hypothetical protein CL849_01670 [Crocinitomicaceae bacterium]|nr:hypothetical protein [Crocinitomicaceae bacterium]
MHVRMPGIPRRRAGPTEHFARGLLHPFENEPRDPFGLPFLSIGVPIGRRTNPQSDVQSPMITIDHPGLDMFGDVESMGSQYGGRIRSKRLSHDLIVVEIAEKIGDRGSRRRTTGRTNRIRLSSAVADIRSHGRTFPGRRPTHGPTNQGRGGLRRW